MSLDTHMVSVRVLAWPGRSACSVRAEGKGKGMVWYGEANKQIDVDEK